MQVNKLSLFQWAVGACDACTGFLLLIAPAWTVEHMGVTQVSMQTDMLSYVGVFVMAVGWSYFLVRADQLEQWKMQWKVTSMMRLLVALFLAWKMAFSGWDASWFTVLLTDLAVGLTQVTGLRLGWLSKGDRAS